MAPKSTFMLSESPFWLKFPLSCFSFGAQRVMVSDGSLILITCEIHTPLMRSNGFEKLQTVPACLNQKMFVKQCLQFGHTGTHFACQEGVSKIYSFS